MAAVVPCLLASASAPASAPAASAAAPQPQPQVLSVPAHQPASDPAVTWYPAAAAYHRVPPPAIRRLGLGGVMRRGGIGGWIIDAALRGFMRVDLIGLGLALWIVRVSIRS